MAFTYQILEQTIFGSKKLMFGSFANTDGSSGGNLDTGLTMAEIVLLQSAGTAELLELGATAHVNADLPVNGRSVPIVTSANMSGCWVALGY